MQNDIKTSSFTVMRKFNPENDFDFFDDNPIEMEKILKDLNRRVQNKDPIEDTYINKNINKNINMNINKNADKNTDKNADKNADNNNDYKNDYNIDTFMDISTLTANFSSNLNIFDPYTMFNEIDNDNDNYDCDNNNHNDHNDYDNANDNIYDDYIPSTQRWTNYFG
jgi:hypothetical protein